MARLPILDTLQAWDAALASSTAGYFARLYAGFYTISILASLWVYCLARRLPPGLSRAAACLPVVVLQLAATPLLVDRTRTPVLIVPVCGMLSLAAFKVAAFAMGRGPLAMSQFPWARNLLQFGVVLSLPVIPKDAFKLGAGASLSDLGSAAPASWPVFLKLYGYKAGGAAAAASLAVWPALPELVRHWFYALCLSLSLGAMWDFWCCVAVVTAGIPVAPSFDKPWLSTSFADYWSRRWNLTTAYLLRVLLYEPVREGRFVPAAAPSTAAAPARVAGPARTLPVKSAQAAAAAAAAAAPAGPEEDDDAPASCPDSSTDMSAGHHQHTDSKPAKAAIDMTADSSAVDRQECLSRSSSGSAGSIGSCSAVETGAPTAATPQLPAAAAAAARKETPAQAVMRRVAGTHATFFFSGLWHLLIFYYATGLVTYHWVTFFTVQGPIMVAETVLKHYAKRAGLRLPYAASVFLTNFLLIVVARPLFFGPCDWSGLCTAMMDNVKSSVV